MNRTLGPIGILWLRQIKRMVRSRARMLGSLGQPVLFLVALGFGFGPIYAKAGGGNYLQFLAPGVICMSILFTGIFSGLDIIWDRRFGFLKETLVAPVPRFAVMLGRTLGGATLATLQGIVVLLIAVLIGFRPENWLLLPLAIFNMALIALLFTAVGSCIACLIDDMQAFPLVINFLVMPLFFLSGALFPLDTAPAGLQLVAMFDPLSYGVDALRSSLTGVEHFGPWINYPVLLVVSLGFLILGGRLFGKMEA